MNAACRLHGGPVMHMLRIALALALLAVAVDGHAQLAKNAAYVELGGSGIVPTLNYERHLNERWVGRIGFSVVTGETQYGDGTTDSDTSFVVPLTASWLSAPAASHHLELGGGLTLAGGDRQDLFDLDDDEENFSTAFVTGLVGYRYQRPGRGFQFRAAFTPIAGGGEIVPWFGVSFGYGW